MARTAHTLNPDFNEETVVVRGVSYRFRELSIGEYDDIFKKATTTRTNPLTGEDAEETDNALLLRLMVIACSVEPKLSAEKLSGFPMRAALTFNRTVNRMHFGDEPESKPKDDDDEEEESKGNDSPPAT